MEANISMNRCILNADINKKAFKKTAGILTGILLLVPVTASAAPDLTDIFTTKAFQGSWEVVYQFNWLGGIMNYIISFFCLLGLMLIMYSRMVTLLYLSSRNTWDNVHDIKESSKGAFLGFPALFQNTMQSNYGSGLDAFVSFFLGLLPDIKKYSDYNPDNMNKGTLNDDDNALNYILKTALPTILLMFFLAIGFSGTLARSYGTVVSGMARFADDVVTVNLDQYVDEIFTVGSTPDSTLKDGSEFGNLQYTINKNIYSKCLSVIGVSDQDTKDSLQAACETKVTAEFTKEIIQSKSGVTVTKEADWKNVKPNVTMSKNSAGSANAVIIPVTDILPGSNSGQFIHITFKKSGTQENYFGQNP